VKSPTQRRVAIAALLLAPLLTACGFNEQTDQVYQPAVGVNDRSGNVDILNALIVSGTDGSGTFAGTLVNKNQTEDDALQSLSGPDVTASRGTVKVAAGQAALLADSGALSLTGDGIVPGKWVELTFVFSSGQSTTMKVPVVEASGDYADVPPPSTATPSSSPSKPSKTTSSSSSSPSASSTAE
jgi:hypothetical protein